MKYIPLQILITPEIHDKIRAYAYGKKISIAEFMRRAADFYLHDLEKQEEEKI